MNEITRFMGIFHYQIAIMLPACILAILSAESTHREGDFDS